MRRSKSNPAKYARNYRKISQRRMTQYDEANTEEEEIKRLRKVLQSSEKHLKRIEEHNEDPSGTKIGNTSTGGSSSDVDGSNMHLSKKERKRKAIAAEAAAGRGGDNDEEKNILSEDVIEEIEGEGCDLLILPSKKKKRKDNKPSVVLTPEEIREAKLLHKKTSKKLQQLEARAAQKKRRTELYKRLEETSVASSTIENNPSGPTLQSLLTSSGKLSRKKRNNDTKKQTLKKLLNKERAGLTLSAEEKEFLYPSKDVNDDDLLLLPDTDEKDDRSSKESAGDDNGASKEDDGKNTTHAEPFTNKKQQELQDKPKKKKKKKKKSSYSSESNPNILDDEDEDDSDDEPSKKKMSMNVEKNNDDDEEDEEEDLASTADKISDQAKRSDTAADHEKKNKNSNKVGDKIKSAEAPEAIDFAAQMMASLTKLKNESSDSRPTKSLSLEESLEQDKIAARNSNTKKSRYIPSNPAVLKTAASLGIGTVESHGKKQTTVVEIRRPEEIEKSRYDLPVSTMEFEIVDAIRNNDVTIVCGETGSGKSTQVPQFAYENGMTINPRSKNHDESSYIVGITQPRRVAAVSTAKRVCYEMGQGDGQTIRNGPGGKGNLVAYKTRYETAGMGKSTRVQFMTDGILLQEIQHDLLLRRYSVIVLDETHERNLNTDILIGLLSKAIPLRKKAAEEDPENIVPLKLVLMSATLRVEDFTKNNALFPTGPPAVVSVPGRTFPVTIHHSKITELDDYESAAFRKVCRIHRKLPKGGILVFMTGKVEIIRMVNRLRQVLNSTDKERRHSRPKDAIETTETAGSNDDIPRELDDEELDAEDATLDDYDDWDVPEDGTDEPVAGAPQEGSEDIPQKARILPLYSLLSAEEQAKIFLPEEDDDTRLIVISTNVAETSLTIPGISYVVDTGREKCRNYNSGTGVASYDVMWISKASANQRAGRAGRTGPGHCYRLYSSSLFSRHMDAFALPEILTRPLEDVILAMKALNVSNVARFPFPTPPDRSQIDSAVKVLANIGCVDISNVERDGGDGVATRLGKAVSKLPLGVRYAKMLLVAAQAGVLDYAIVLVAILSEDSPFANNTENAESDDNAAADDGEDDDLDNVDKNLVKEQERRNAKKSKKWNHRGGDLLAAMLAVGAYTYAGRGAGGSSESLANRKFCEENGLNYTIMSRIQRMRSHLASISKNRLGSAAGVAATTGGFSFKMTPPNKLQERLLIQAVVSGLLDHVAVLAPPGSMSGKNNSSLRSAYILCTAAVNEPLFLDRTSTVYTRDYRQLPRWVCYDSIIRKTTKDGTPIAVMKNITPIEASWLGDVAKGTQLLSYGEPLVSPSPVYDSVHDAVLCSVATKFGSHGFEIPPVKLTMYDVLQSHMGKQAAGFQPDDSFRWFARFLLEGKVFPELEALELNDSPALITRRSPLAKVNLFVGALSSVGVDSARALRKHWAEDNDKFLFKQLKQWIKVDHQDSAKKLWIETVRRNVTQLNSGK